MGQADMVIDPACMRYNKAIMLHAFLLSFQSLSDKRVLGVLAKTVLLTLLVFSALGIGLYFSLGALFARMGLGDDMLSAVATFILLVLGGLLLFRIISVAILWIFSDEVVDAVEDRYYPDHAARSARPRFVQSVGMAVRSVARVLGYNLLALPVYVLLLITGIGIAIAFLGVNALLLGRDLEDMLVTRHGKGHGQLGPLKRFAIGLLGTAIMLIPFVNLLVPVVITAMAVHVVHGQEKGTV
jgi:CysZ protein